MTAQPIPPPSRTLLDHPEAAVAVTSPLLPVAPPSAVHPWRERAALPALLVGLVASLLLYLVLGFLAVRAGFALLS